VADPKQQGLSLIMCRQLDIKQQRPDTFIKFEGGELQSNHQSWLDKWWAFGPLAEMKEVTVCVH
jgi:hypothetical protein